MTFRGKLMAILMGVVFLTIGTVANSCGNHQEIASALQEIELK